MPLNFKGPRDKISITRATLPEYEKIVLNAYLTILKTLKDDRFNGMRPEFIEAEIASASTAREKFAKEHLLGHLKILEAQISMV